MSKRQWTITLIIILLLVVGTGVTLVNKKYIDRHFNYAVEITQTKSASSAERGSDSPAEETKGNETLAAGVSGAGRRKRRHRTHRKAPQALQTDRKIRRLRPT